MLESSHLRSFAVSFGARSQRNCSCSLGLLGSPLCRFLLEQILFGCPHICSCLSRELVSSSFSCWSGWFFGFGSVCVERRSDWLWCCLRPADLVAALVWFRCFCRPLWVVIAACSAAHCWFFGSLAVGAIGPPIAVWSAAFGFPIPILCLAMFAALLVLLLLTGCL
ncbi:hypothetical protein U1Q18_025075 [Sarracenia purpurea var. burkii]